MDHWDLVGLLKLVRFDRLNVFVYLNLLLVLCLFLMIFRVCFSCGLFYNEFVHVS